MAKPMAAVTGKQPPGDDEDHDADNGDGRVLAGQVGRRAFADGAGNLLHAGVAGVGGQHGLDRPYRVDDTEHAAGDDEIKRKSLLIFPWKTPSRVGRGNAAAMTGRNGTPAGY